MNNMGLVEWDGCADMCACVGMHTYNIYRKVWKKKRTGLGKRVVEMSMSFCFAQDFGKFPRMRTFVQEYLQALNCQNDGTRVVQSFIER